ncbi:MAG: hypothetical protein P1P85_00095 [Patescibacteria group bacterium]|nr:hypothetical protein [Patescibacteria group bacterium]
MQYHLFTDYYFMMLGLMGDFYKSLLPEGVIKAIFIFIVGLIFAIEFSKFAKKLAIKAGIDKTLEKMGVKNLFKKAGIKFSIADAIGWLVKWFILLFALMSSVDALNLPQVSQFLSVILGYIPSLFGALIILTVGLIVSQLVYEAVEGGSKATGIRMYHIAAIAFKWVIVVVTLLVVLEQIEIKTEILKIFAGGLSLMIAIAGGLAFGLGGQYHAKELLDELKSKIRK